MSDETVVVTRKGQVTIPAGYRRKYRIYKGTKLSISESQAGIVLKPITPIEDLAGIDAGKVSIEQMKRKLDEMRSQDRI